MVSYLLVFFILSCFSLSPYIKQGRVLKIPFLILCYFILFLFAGLREVGVGSDDFNYVNRFLEIPDISQWINGNYNYSYSSSFMEPLYVAYGSFIRLFTDDYVFLFMGVAFLSISFAVQNYYRYSHYVFLTLLLFFVHTYLYRDINQIRSAVAAAIGLFLIAQIHNRQHVKVWCTLFLAGMFHMASVVLCFAYLLSFFNVTRRRVIAAYCLSLLLGVIGVSQLVFQLIPGGGVLAGKLYNYTENSNYLNAVSLFDITNIKNSAILFVIILFWKRLEKIVPHFTTFVLFYLLAVGVRIAFWDLGVLAARTSTFFAIVEVILIPYFIFIFRNKIFITLLIILYAFLTLYLNLFIKDGRNPYGLSIF